MTFNILKHPTGQVNEAMGDGGKKVYRADKVLFMVGEVVQLVDTVYDNQHFLYQYRNPITKEEYEHYRNTSGKIPLARQGPSVRCSCGSEGVIIVDSKAPKEWQNKIICKAVAQYGIHMTSFKIVDNKASMPKQIADEKLMTDSDLDRLYKKDK